MRKFSLNLVIQLRKTMTTQINYSELVTRLQEDKAAQRDFVVSGSAIKMLDGDMVLSKIPGGIDDILESTGIQSDGTPFMSTETLHNQVGEKLTIPKRYYDKMLREATGLLDTNVNHWLRDRGNDKFLLRTFMYDDGRNIGRAFLSDSFKIMDNIDVLAAAIESIKSSEFASKIKIDSCSITEKKMYVRFVAPEIELLAPELLEKYRVPGQGNNGKTGIATGFILTNSETGHGRFSISPRAVIAACKNGMIFKDDAFNRTHLGAKMDEGSVKYSGETMQKNMELIVSQVRDAVNTFLSPDYLGKKVEAMRVAAGYKPQDAIVAIENTCNTFGISEEHRKNILNYFIEGGDNSVFGVSQAITFAAHKDMQAEDRQEAEYAGYSVLEQFKNIFDVVPVS